MSREQVTHLFVVMALFAWVPSAGAQQYPSTWQVPVVEPPNGVLPTLPDHAEPIKASPAIAPPNSADAGPVQSNEIAELAEEAAWSDWVSPSYWYQSYWLPGQAWESSFELGIDGSEGNSQTLTFRSGVDIRHKIDWSDLQVAISYVKSTAQQAETKHNAQLDANHDWLFNESSWSVFVKSILVYDEFRPFDLELTLSTGLGYQFIDTDVWSLKGQFGSGATRQWDGPADRWRPEAMFGLDFEYTISARQKLRIKSEFFPQWDDYEIYRVRTDAGWEMLLDEATNMSLKLGVIDRYDSNAGSAKPNALDYSLLLLWKL